MEINLSNSDIETMIKERYEGVSEVKFNTKKLKVTLIVNDINKFNFDKKRKQIINTEPVEQLPERTLEQINAEAKAKGLMMQGGSERTLMRF